MDPRSETTQRQGRRDLGWLGLPCYGARVKIGRRRRLAETRRQIEQTPASETDALFVLRNRERWLARSWPRRFALVGEIAWEAWTERHERAAALYYQYPPDDRRHYPKLLRTPETVMPPRFMAARKVLRRWLRAGRVVELPEQDAYYR